MPVKQQPGSWGYLFFVCLASCRPEPLAAPPARSLDDARHAVLEHFARIEGFKLENQMQAALAGLPALRMEAAWKDGGQGVRAIVYLLEQPAWFNVIYYAAPAENGIFEEGLPTFRRIMRSLRPLESAAGLEVLPQEAAKLVRSPELRLEFLVPADWTSTLDVENRALVLSGPRRERSWLQTVSFSVVHKWPQS